MRLIRIRLTLLVYWPIRIQRYSNTKHSVNEEEVVIRTRIRVPAGKKELGLGLTLTLKLSITLTLTRTFIEGTH